jgi:hypothetical protein
LTVSKVERPEEGRRPEEGAEVSESDMFVAIEPLFHADSIRAEEDITTAALFHFIMVLNRLDAHIRQPDLFGYTLS